MRRKDNYFLQNLTWNSFFFNFFSK